MLRFFILSCVLPLSAVATSLRSELLQGMEMSTQLAMREKLFTSALADACPQDACALCAAVDEAPALGSNTYSCGSTDCCGIDCSDLGEELTYLDNYIELLQPLAKKLLTDETAVMAEIKNSEGKSDAEKDCLKAKAKLRETTLTRLNAKVQLLRIERGGVMFSLKRVFRQCVDNTWCENDDTQSLVFKDTIWDWFSENQCGIYSYAIDIAAAVIDLGIQLSVPLLAAWSQSPVCQVVGTSFNDAAGMKAGISQGLKDNIIFVVSGMTAALCQLKSSVDNDVISTILYVFCWADFSTATRDLAVDVDDDTWAKKLALLNSLFTVILSVVCGNVVQALVEIFKVPLLCTIDTCNAEFGSDCSKTILAQAFGLGKEDSETTTLPTKVESSITSTSYVYKPYDVVSGSSFSSNSSVYRFAFENGNVALYKGSDLRWNTATSCQATCSLKFQDDGNLVLYNSNSAIWNTGTFGSSAGMIFAVSDYGFLQVLDKEFNTQWSSQGLAIPLSSVMSSANKPADWTLTSSNEKFSLQLQKDGNLVIYGPEHAPVWNSGTDGLSGYDFYFEFDATSGIFYVKCNDCNFGTRFNSELSYCSGSDGPFVFTILDQGYIEVQTKANGKICWTSRFNNGIVTKKV